MGSLVLPLLPYYTIVLAFLQSSIEMPPFTEHCLYHSSKPRSCGFHRTHIVTFSHVDLPLLHLLSPKLHTLPLDSALGYLCLLLGTVLLSHTALLAVPPSTRSQSCSLYLVICVRRANSRTVSKRSLLFAPHELIAREGATCAPTPIDL